MLTDFIDLRSANVYGIYGLLGGGKTLTAVEIMLFMLRKGFTVVTNVQLVNLPEGDKGFGRYVFIEDFQGVDFWSLPCGAPRGSPDKFRVCIVIDECAEFFDQYSSSSPVLKSFLSWLRHSSKRGQLVFLIVQQPEFIAKSLRLLVNKWICCVDLAQFRLPVLRVGIPFTSHLVWRRVFDRYANLISRGFNLADKHLIGRYYDTSQSIALAGRSSDYVRSTAFVIDFPFGVFYVLFVVCILVLFFFS